MACETYLKPQQTPQERLQDIQKAMTGLDAALRMRNIKPVVGPQGAITFPGWTNGRDGVTDACAYRRIMATGSTLAKMAIAQAEQIAGRTVDRAVIGQGVQSHDGGKTWGKH